MKSTHILLIVSIVFSLAGLLSLQAQEEVQVISIGETIQPEKKAKPKGPARLRKGTRVSVEVAQVLSSALNQEGEKVLIRARKRVGAIPKGAPGWARLEAVQKSNEAGRLVLRLESIQDRYGNSHPLTGLIAFSGQNSQAVLVPGHRGEGKISQSSRVVYRRLPKQKKSNQVGGTVDLSKRRLQLVLDKKSYKTKRSKVKAVVEVAKPYSAGDLDADTLAVFAVNGQKLPRPVLADARRPKQGDANKNGQADWTVYFNLYDLAKYLKRGSNQLSIEGSLGGAKRLVVPLRVEAEY